MANAALAYLNLADSGNISTSSQAITMPISNLQTPHVLIRWRSVINDAYFVIDLLSVQSVDTVMLRGLTLGTNGTVRLRLSATDPTGATGELLDTGLVTTGTTENYDADYGSFVYVLSAAVNARYVRIDLADADSTYVEAGRVFVGKLTRFTYNYNWGWSLGYVDRSARPKSRGGQTLVLEDNQYRVLNVDFGWVSSAQRYGIVESVDRVNGQHTDVLLVTDTESENLARDSIWGLVSNLTPVVNPALADIFGKSYQIEERL